MARTYHWDFPLPRVHTGMLQGNGTLGSIIWGSANQLNITLNRADFWDHRGGKPWTDQMTYANIRRLLEAGDEKGLRQMFEQGENRPGQPASPTVLPLGRIEIVFDQGIELKRGTLDLDTGEVTVLLAAPDGREHEASIVLSMHDPIVHVRLPEELGVPTIRPVTSWRYNHKHLASISFKEPEAFEQATVSARMEEGMDEPPLSEETVLSGWVQERPADPAACVAYHLRGADIWLAVVYGADPTAAQANAARLIDQSCRAGLDQLHYRNVTWWSAYWAAVPRVQIPNEKLAFLYYYGMYKFAALTNPTGVPATLQGPWVDEQRMPCWSSDYHFNINVQMCYSPAYRGNRLEHLRPLFDMVWSWRDRLRQIARTFVGVDDGLMLPHAVDDRGVNMGGFWAGTIDHGCTAWVGKMMYDYWLYGGGDEHFLRTVAYPFMAGAMRVYERMLEQKPDGSYVLPVSVSPEYRGSAMNAWGANASFQLACIHWLLEALLHTCQVLGESPKPLWHDLQQKLPRVCLIGNSNQQQIALWQGTPLEESHRHHSHLAAITPFDVIDPKDPAWQPIVERSLRRWIAEGMGYWSGWCISWASMIHSHVGNADTAELLLEIWDRVFTNQGHGTLHNVDFPGFSLTGAGATYCEDWGGEVMQLDAGLGTTAAIMDMLLHTRRGTHYILPGAPNRWRDVEFTDLRTEGAFLVSARRAAGQVQFVRIHSERPGTFRLSNPWGATSKAAVKRADGRRHSISGGVLEIPMSKGEVAEITPDATAP